MPIHFSIGFVVEASPKSPWVSVCARVADYEEVDAVVVEETELTACWPRENGSECNGGV
jgi:hypothetical protein